MMRLLSFTAILLLASPFAALAQADDIPHPALDEFKPEIKEMLAGARGRFELMALQAEERQLGIAYGRLGIHYYAHAIQDAARACFEKAAVLDNENHRWPYYLGVQYAETGNFDGAAEQFRRVLALQPGDIPASTRLGQAQLELDQASLAEAEFRKVLAVDATNAPALAGLARVAEDREDWSVAIDYYQQALASQPEASQLHYRLGQTYRQSGDVEQATVHLAQSGSRIPSIADPLLQFMDAHTKPASYYVALGDRALKEESPNSAWKYFDVASAIDPTDSGALTGKARIRFLTGEFDRASSLVDVSLKMDPDNAAALQLKGMLSEAAGDLASAASYYQASLGAADNPQTHVMLGDLLMREGAYPKAREHYSIAGAAGDASAGAKYRLGMVNIALGDCAAAEPELLRAYELDQGLTMAIEALSRLYSTCVDATDEKRSTALSYAQMRYDGNPGLRTAETLAMIMAARQRYEDAVDFQAQAIFEALKTGSLEQEPQLKENMERYRNQQRASLPWPPGHAVFSGR